MLPNHPRIDCIAVSVSSLLTMYALAGYTQAKVKPTFSVSILQALCKAQMGPDLDNDGSNGKP